MGLLEKTLARCGKPSGWAGRLNLWAMNRRHFRLTTWGLSHVSIRPRDTILDVGCGGGATIARLAALATDGKTVGVDHSPASVAASRRTNRLAIGLGRVEILQASVSDLPFSDDVFDSGHGRGDPLFLARAGRCPA